MTKIKRYRADAYRQFQKAALSDRGGEMQLGILDAVRSRKGADFVQWLDDLIRHCAQSSDIIIGDEEPAIPVNPPVYTVGDFLQPPDPASMWEAWRSITPGIACSSSVWAYIVARLIGAEKIQPHYLVAESKSAKPNGKAEIDEALRATGDQKKSKVDGRVRAFLRRLSGIYERGARSVYENCPPASAWWQYYIARQAAQNAGCDAAEVITVLKAPGIWSPLVEKMASRLTVIGDINLRDGLVMFLLEGDNAKRYNTKTKLAPLFRSIGIMSAWRAIGYFPPDQVRDIIREIAPPDAPKDSDSGENGVKSDKS